MINYDDITKGNISKHKLNWPRILVHPCRILVIGNSGSGKTNALLNLIKQQDDDDYSIIDKIYLYVKDSSEAKYRYLIKECENNNLKNLKNPKAFIEYSNNMEITTKAENLMY